MKKLIITALLLATQAAYASDNYVLYRKAIIGTEDIHIATFDSKERSGLDHSASTLNNSNCQEVAKKLNKNGNMPSVYWCKAVK
jgi:hypothetical protein